MNLNPSVIESREGNGWLQFSLPKCTESFEDITKIAEHVKSDSIHNGARDGRQCACLCCASRDQTPGIRGIPLIRRIDRDLEFCSKRMAELAEPSIAAIAGYALGGGCEVALCSIVGRRERVSGLTGIKLAQGGMQRLPCVLVPLITSRLN